MNKEYVGKEQCTEWECVQIKGVGKEKKARKGKKVEKGKDRR